MQTEEFKKEYMQKFQDIFAFSMEDSTPLQQYIALGEWLRAHYGPKWRETNKRYASGEKKQIYYFSIEFLPGRMLRSNLLNLGILEEVRTGIEALNLDFTKICEAEVDPALGNGGLGRLASCFLDGMASIGMAGHGNGIRYRYGLFQQKFMEGYQIELPEDWLKNGNVWEVRKINRSVIVRFRGQVYHERDREGKLRIRYANTQNILAVPYDIPQVGYENGVINNLRLWSAEIPEGEEASYRSYEEREAVSRITQVLYPDDSNYEGQLLRLQQEYFFSSAGVQSILRTFKKYGLPWSALSKRIGIHINDTHPALVIPELMRILMDEEGLGWDEAWKITTQTISYTNHTILQEAMERWPESMLRGLIPRIYEIIAEINRRHLEAVIVSHGERIAYSTSIIEHDMVKMANLSILSSHSINGVAKIHTDILKDSTLHDFYLLQPEKFNNKTNGITLRRWVFLSNEGLTKLIDDKIGKAWRTDGHALKEILTYQDDTDFLDRLNEVKRDSKQRFAAYIRKNYNITLPEDALFDVQVKRLHAYKRQLLNIFHIIDRYLTIKAHPDLVLQPRVFIFGAKAAPSYYYAKNIIKLMNEVASLINKDPDVKDQMKVVFVENYGVSLAELIIPAADISEQISLAGKEASGTSNMKLMANGALTMATMDGANIEIHDYVGDENMFVFGLREHEVKEYYRNGSYRAADIYEKDLRVQRIINTLIDGTIPHIEAEGRNIFDSLIRYNDEYFVLADLRSYLEAQAHVDERYQDKRSWARSSLVNIAKSGAFSADDTIRRYADEIWDAHYGK
ncbi:MAG: glycogen/starch/alpha-glucan phosphorylase [Mobilitalea sp.]